MTETEPNPQWYVLRSKPHKEPILARELEARGLECYYPQLHVNPVNPRSRKIQPYFPGYLFIYADITQIGISALKWMPYSSGLVSFDGIPATVPPHLVQAIHKHLDELNGSGGSRLRELKRGEAVVIQGGPFHGHEAIFDARLPGRERVRVLLKLLQRREMKLDLPESQVEPRRKARR